VPPWRKPFDTGNHLLFFVPGGLTLHNHLCLNILIYKNPFWRTLRWDDCTWSIGSAAHLSPKTMETVTAFKRSRRVSQVRVDPCVGQPSVNRTMRRLSILIADDAPDICSLLSLWLRGHHHVCVHSGADALKLLHFDLVITDIHMPDMSGLNVIRRLKQRQPWVRVVAISGGSRFSSADDYLMPAIEGGADAAVMKPFSEDRLLGAVRTCWEKCTHYDEPLGAVAVNTGVQVQPFV